MDSPAVEAQHCSAQRLDGKKTGPATTAARVGNSCPSTGSRRVDSPLAAMWRLALYHIDAGHQGTGGDVPPALATMRRHDRRSQYAQAPTFSRPAAQRHRLLRERPPDPAPACAIGNLPPTGEILVSQSRREKEHGRVCRTGQETRSPRSKASGQYGECAVLRLNMEMGNAAQPYSD